MAGLDELNDGLLEAGGKAAEVTLAMGKLQEQANIKKFGTKRRPS